MDGWMDVFIVLSGRVLVLVGFLLHNDGIIVELFLLSSCTCPCHCHIATVELTHCATARFEESCGMKLLFLNGSQVMK